MYYSVVSVLTCSHHWLPIVYLSPYMRNMHTGIYVYGMSNFVVVILCLCNELNLALTCQAFLPRLEDIIETAKCSHF